MFGLFSMSVSMVLTTMMAGLGCQDKLDKFWTTNLAVQNQSTQLLKYQEPATAGSYGAERGGFSGR